MEKLSPLQQQILKHFFSCKQGTENVSHLSKEISALQPAVFRSITSLIKYGYLVKQKKFIDGEKVVTLTDKGAATALLLGISREKIEKYLERSKKRNAESGLQILIDLVKDADKQDLILTKGAQFLLDREWFDKYSLDGTEKMQMIAFLLLESRLRDAVKWDTDSFLEYIRRFHINSQLLLNVLQEKQQIINSLINLLTSKSDKSEESGITKPRVTLTAHQQISHLRQESQRSSHDEQRIKVRN